MKKMKVTEFDHLSIIEKKKMLPVEVISRSKETIFFALPDTPESRSAANTYTEDQVIRIIAHMLGRAEAEQRLQEFKNGEIR